MQRNGAIIFGWGRVPAHSKAMTVSATAPYAATKSTKATAGLRQPRAMLQTGRCHIALSPRENPLPAALLQNYLTTC